MTSALSSHLSPLFCFFSCSGDPRALHSFPTRRSSDLPPERLRSGVSRAQEHPIVGRHYRRDGWVQNQRLLRQLVGQVAFETRPGFNRLCDLRALEIGRAHV